MKVYIKYNNDVIEIEENVSSKFRYITKTIELFDDYTCKYTHVYDDHISTKVYHSCSKYNKYLKYFQ